MFTCHRIRSLLAALACTSACIAVPAAYAQSDRDLDVQVQIVGDEVQSNATLFVRAPQQRVWDVMTDYERAPEFTRDLQISKVVSRSGNTVRILQKNQVRVGPFAVPVETVRDVKLQAPVKMDARLVSGSMKKFDSSTELIPENGGTRIVFRSQAVLNPMLAGFATESFVKRETETRMKELRTEIMRREHVASARP
jgi:carbon monoxide dehydrogenase subunit G